MNHKQIQERIMRCKCDFCNDRRKKLVTIKDSKNTLLGYSAVCCSCGYVKHFALQYDAIPVYAAGLKEGRVANVDIACGTDKIDVCRYCEDTKCPCRPELPQERESHTSSERNWAAVLRPVVEKYEGYNYGDKEGVYRG